MKQNILENHQENVLIILNAIKKVMIIFLGPFLTAYFIQTSTDSIIVLSLFNIFSYSLLAVFSIIIGKIIKNTFKMQMFRIGVVLNFIYILTIIILNENIVNHLILISILYGLSSACYWFPFNLLIVNKIENSNRTKYFVKSSIISSLIGVICPLLLGSLITVTNYVFTAVLMLLLSLSQIYLSFVLKINCINNYSKFNLKTTWKKLKTSKEICCCLFAEFFIGMTISDGALDTVLVILILDSFNTDMNLGIITSIITFISMITLKMYGNYYKYKSDKNIILFSSVIPVITLLTLILIKSDLSLIIFNLCYVVFAKLLSTAREIRLFNIANGSIVNEANRSEFFSIRECILNLGRIFSYLLLLIAGISQQENILVLVMILLTISIFFLGFNINKVNKIQ